MTDLMLDLECFSKRVDAAIVQIGAVPFDPRLSEFETGPETLVDSLRLFPDLDEQLKYGAHIDSDTIQWWLGQVAKGTPSPFGPRSSIASALHELSRYIKEHEIRYIWAKSPQYDNAILSLAYDRCNIKTPWNYKNVRDVRTLLFLVQEIFPVQEIDPGHDFQKAPDIFGSKHDAVVDCRTQIWCVRKAMRMLGSK